MSQLTPDALESLLTEYGWSFETAGDNVWSTGFQGEQRLYPLTIKLTSTCVSFEVRPLIDSTLEVTHWPELSRELLELNARMQLVKVGLAGGEVCLSCQVLAAGFDFDMLTRVLGIIGYYADEVAPDIASRIVETGYEGRPALLS